MLSDFRVQIVPIVLLSSIFKAGLSFAFISTSFDLNPYLHPISTRPAPAGAAPSDNSGSTFKLCDKRERPGNLTTPLWVTELFFKIARIFFVGKGWAKVMAILNCALHRAFFIPGNFMRFWIIVAHFARTVSEQLNMITRKSTRT
ncbi:MAG: hypothetical protein Q8S57_03965 [Methanoregula sp.]|nr:hypothetical protein [Methanoregula sp.]